MRKLTKNEFKEEIISNLEELKENIKEKKERRFFDGSLMTNTIFVSCNNVSNIIYTALAAVKEVKDYEIYLQRNVFPIELAGFPDETDYKAFFNYFCTYFDKKHYNSLHFNKKLINYSKGNQEEIWIDYPSEIEMILIIENFNFWDLNAQLGLSRLSQNPNIMVIGQIRTDFDFASSHIDVEATTNASHFELEE
jgi:hypothetical protein